MKTIPWFLALIFIFSGCTHVISEESRNLVDPSISFSQLRNTPDSLTGKYVMLGGVIAGVLNEKEGSQLEVVQTPHAGDALPEDLPSASAGRFLAVTSAFLDPMVYKTGRRVTLVGQVQGRKVQMLDKTEYSYPVVSIREIYVWKKSETEPSHLPSYGYYYYDPFWWGPWGPPYWWYRRPWLWY